MQTIASNTFHKSDLLCLGAFIWAIVTYFAQFLPGQPGLEIGPVTLYAGTMVVEVILLLSSVVVWVLQMLRLRKHDIYRRMARVQVRLIIVMAVLLTASIVAGDIVGSLQYETAGFKGGFMLIYVAGLLLWLCAVFSVFNLIRFKVAGHDKSFRVAGQIGTATLLVIAAIGAFFGFIITQSLHDPSTE